jgi:beta-lactamase regulating signal transducer with metallopeptidase domain
MIVLNGLSGLLLTCGPDALPRLLTPLGQATIPLAAGLLFRRALQRRGPAARLLLANGTLFAVLAVVSLSLCLAGRYRALWTFSLPTPSPIMTVPPSSPHPVAANPPVRNLPSVYIDTNRQPVQLSPDSFASTSRVRARTIGLNAGQTGEIKLSSGGPADAGDIKSPSGGLAANRPTGRNSTREFMLDSLSGATWCASFVVVWCVGTVLLLGWLTLSCLSIACLRRRCLPVQDDRVREMLLERSAAMGVRPPQLLVSDRARGPFLTGLVRPAIVLPVSYQADFGLEELRAVLTHELAHLAQRDGWWTLLARLLCAVCWPHPLLWALCRERAEAGEEACDMMVLAQGCSGPAYARCLIALAERLHPPRILRAATLGMIGSRSALSRRIESILSGLRQSPPALSIRVKLPIFVLIPALVCVALYFVGTTGREQPHLAVVSSVFRPASGGDPDRLRKLEIECALARQQVAIALTSKNISLNALLQQQVQSEQLSAQVAQAEADAASAEAPIMALQAQADELRQRRDNDLAAKATRRNDLAIIEAQHVQLQAQVATSLAQQTSIRARLARQQAVMEQRRQQLAAAQIAVMAAQRRLVIAEAELLSARANQAHDRKAAQAALAAAGATMDARRMKLAATQATAEAAKLLSAHQHELTILRQRLLQYQAQRDAAYATQLSQRQSAELARMNAELARENVPLDSVKTNLANPSREEVSREEVWDMALKLIDAQTQLDKLRTEYTANHPRMKAGQEWVNQLSTRLKQLMDAATPDVRYDVLGLELDELRHERNDAMDDLVDLKTQYTSATPRVHAAEQRLNALDAELRTIQERRDQLYTEMKAGPAPPGASLVIKRSLFHFAGDPPPPDYIFRTHDHVERKLPDGAGPSRTDSPIDEGEEVQWEIHVSGYTGKTLEIQLLQVSEYDDRDGHVLKSNTRLVHNEVYEVGSGRTTVLSHTEPAKPSDFPPGTATLKYRYELKAQIRNESGPHASASQSSATHTITIDK